MVALALPVLMVRPAAAADAAWRTFIRTVSFTDLVTTGTEVWGATSQGGLLHFDRATGAFDVVRREPGSIASNSLTRLAFDRSGKLWVGTRGNGVSRRNAGATTWEVVNVLDGLPSDSVNTLEVQGDTLWIGTRRGLALWNGREVTGALPDGITTSFDTTFALPAVSGIAVMGDSLFLATPRGAGLARLSTLLGDWRPVNQGLPSREILSLASDGTDLFARVGTEVYRFRFDLGQWESAGLAGPVFTLEDDGGAILAVNDAGVERWDPAAVGWIRVGEPLPVGPASLGPVVAADSLGNYVAAFAETLYDQPFPVPLEAPARAVQAPAWSLHPAPDGPTFNNLFAVAIDRSRIYVTTVNAGMGRFDGTSWYHWRGTCTGTCDTTFLRSSFAFGLMVDALGHKWVGAWSAPPYPALFGPGGSMSEFTDSLATPAFIHHFQVNDISEIDLMKHTWALLGVTDHLGQRWFGTATPAKGDFDPIGLEWYDALGAYQGHFDPSNSSLSGLFITGMGTTRNGRVWLGFDGQGVDYFLPGTGPISFEHLRSTDGLSVRGLTSHGDSLWILAGNQLQLFDQGASPLSSPDRVITLSGGQPALEVNPLVAGPDGRLWVGSDVGVKMVTAGGAITSFTAANSPLPADEVRGLAIEPGGAVWITTTAGLARFDPGYVPVVPRLPSLRIRVFPNPATLTRLGVGLRLTGEARSYRGTIHDLSGRRVRRFEAADGAVFWDGRDEQGHLVQPGIYFVRAEGGGRVAVARVALFH
jgi:hypothetical protein